MRKTPVSDELRESILAVLNKRREAVGRERGVLNIRAGAKPGEIVYVALEMNISCIVSEDEAFFWFHWEYGKKQKARKGAFLSELSQKLAS
ncbi:MAG: hypothetical protein NT026_00335 [Candidatus Staskawiczbacteria bacterium]|nr:hypothetical protein [Candidatus Staskawiczbacteria bacterium]